jgi:carboxymethylenebutenolidase
VDIGYAPADIARGRELKGRARLDAAMLDIAAARDAVPDVRPFAVIGYCWGGYVAWMAASRLAGLACVVAYYGGGMLDAIGEQPKCPVMAHFGERDAMLPVAGVHQLMAAHPRAQVHTYAADHGFNCDQRPSYDAAAAKLARERTLQFLWRHLG